MGVFEHFPYSNFHDMNLDWILGLLKKWEDIADNIGEMIDDAVENGLSELNIEEIITNILINYEFAINVKNPPQGLTPAKGDGTTDDTAAINGCVNYAAGLPNGGIVFFPQGLYLTDTVNIPSNVTLMGLSKHNVKLVKKASANSTFIGGNGSNNAIYGITFDGNQVSSTVQVNGFIGTPVDLEIRECNIDNCGGRGVSWSGTNLTIDSVEFDNSGINCLLLNGNGNVSVKNVLFKSLSEVSGDGVIVVNSDNCDIEFSSVANCSKCLVLEGENNYVHCRITGATIPVTDNGSENNVINVVGDYKIGADNLQVNVGGDTTVNGQDVVINGTQHVDINGADVVLNPTNPLTYKKPTEYNTYFDSVKFKNGTDLYDVLVAGENIVNLGDFINIKNFGAVGDGITDDTDAIQSAINSANAGDTIIIPNGNYLIKQKGSNNYILNVDKNIRIIGCGYNSKLLFDRNTPSTCDIINFQPQTVVENMLSQFSNFYIAYTGQHDLAEVPGRDILYINCEDPNIHIQRFLISRLYIPTVNRYAISLNNPEGTDSFFCGNIEQCNLGGGIYLLGCGDSVNILDNTIGGDSTGIYIKQVSGAARIFIGRNNITSHSEAVYLVNCRETKIEGNQIESIESGGTTQASIFIVDSEECCVNDNNVNSHSNKTYGITIESSNNCSIFNNSLYNFNDAAINIANTSKYNKVGKNIYNKDNTQLDYSIYNTGINTEGVWYDLVLEEGVTINQASVFGSPSVMINGDRMFFRGSLITTITTGTVAKLPSNLEKENVSCAVIGGYNGTAVVPVLLYISNSGINIIYEIANLINLFLESLSINLVNK